MKTIEIIKRRIKERDTLVCAGIDPNLERMPEIIRNLDLSDEEKILKFLYEYIDIVAPHVCVFKAQKAYFDLLSGGHDVLKQVIGHVHQKHDIPVIVDCKVGDIDETMTAYLKNIFDLLGADGIVVNPYMGDDVMQSFEAYSDKLIVVLVKTSNPGGSIVQDIRTEDGRYLWERMLELVLKRWNLAGNMVPVISSTQEIDMHAIRAIIGDDVLVLFAGMGAQGGSAHDLEQLLDSQKGGVIVNSSRGLLYPETNDNETWQEAVLRSVVQLKDELNTNRA